jgi:hypothetical protein
MSSKSKKTGAESKTPVVAPKSIPNDMAPGASSDALKGRVGTRTHAIHVVLMAHYPQPIPRAVIIAESVALLGADHPSSAKFAQTLGSHMNTMKTRGFVERRDGGWVLTESAAGLAGVAAPPAPTKTKRTRKSK